MSYGVYSWKAGAAGPQIVADLIAIASGEMDVNTLSVSCEKAQSSISGAAGTWAALDAPYGVIAAAGIAGGPGMQSRITISGTPKIQLQPVSDWSVGTHAAGYAGTAQDVSLATSAAGAVQFNVTPDGILLAASDWSAWALTAEVKRDAPIFGAGISGQFQVNQALVASMPRVKSPTAVGDVAGPAITIASPYSTLNAAGVRNRAEALYFPMVPVVGYYQQVPVGEVQGVQIVGGYAASGDLVLDAANDTYRCAKTASGVIFAVKRV